MKGGNKMSAFAEKRYIEKALAEATDPVEIAELKERLYEVEIDCKWECIDWEDDND